MVVTNEMFLAGFATLELLIIIGACLLVKELRSWRKEIRARIGERQERR